MLRTVRHRSPRVDEGKRRMAQPITKRKFLSLLLRPKLDNSHDVTENTGDEQRRWWTWKEDLIKIFLNLGIPEALLRTIHFLNFSQKPKLLFWKCGHQLWKTDYNLRTHNTFICHEEMLRWKTCWKRRLSKGIRVPLPAAPIKGKDAFTGSMDISQFSPQTKAWKGDCSTRQHSFRNMTAEDQYMSFKATTPKHPPDIDLISQTQLTLLLFLLLP